jgi:hypothetical protein
MKIIPTIAEKIKIQDVYRDSGHVFKKFFLFYGDIDLPVIVPKANDPRYNSLLYTP